MAYTLTDEQERLILHLLNKVWTERQAFRLNPISGDAELIPGNDLGAIIHRVLTSQHTQHKKSQKMLELFERRLTDPTSVTQTDAQLAAIITGYIAKWKLRDPELPDIEPGRPRGT